MHVLVYKFKVNRGLSRLRLYLISIPCMSQSANQKANFKFDLISRENYLMAYSFWRDEKAMLSFERTNIHVNTLRKLNRICAFEEFHFEFETPPSKSDLELLMNKDLVEEQLKL